MTLQRRRITARGFTLLEVMLAFVIFALSFAVVLEILAGSISGIRRAGDDTQVALFAQSMMDLVGIEIPIEEARFEGEEMDRYYWQLDIYPYEPVDADAYVLELAELSGVELYRVTLDVEWDAGQRQRNARFSTIRSVMAAQ
ncbi:MAG: prepilin-type N-terminal cleavage/methylation domain-containing protein [Lysobacterales bacterium]